MAGSESLAEPSRVYNDIVARRARTIALLLLFVAGVTFAQATNRRFTTIDALRQFPGYYHLQSVTLRGELTDGTQVVIGQFAAGSEADRPTTSTSGPRRNGQ